MKHLFTQDKKEEWTDEAREIDRIVGIALRPVFEYAKQRDYSMRDVQYIVNMVVQDLALYELIGWNDNQEQK